MPPFSKAIGILKMARLNSTARLCISDDSGRSAWLLGAADYNSECVTRGNTPWVS